MTRMTSLIAAALTLGSVAIVPAAEAQRWGGYDGYDGGRYEQPYRGGYGRPGDDQQGYGDRFFRGGDERAYDRGYRGYARSYEGYQRGYRRCTDGATGTIIGALAGGLLGHAVAGRGDHMLGTVLGAGAGALAGRAVERSDNPGYCR